MEVRLSGRRYGYLRGPALSKIFHILSADAARVARENGEYRAGSLSEDGFIHFSCLHQVLEVAESYYAGQHGLALLEVDVSRLKAPLKYEAPSHPVGHASVESPKNEDLLHGERLTSDNSIESPAPDQFPHLYGPLNFDAVVAVHTFEPDASGRFSLPAGLSTRD